MFSFNICKVGTSAVFMLGDFESYISFAFDILVCLLITL